MPEILGRLKHAFKKLDDNIKYRNKTIQKEGNAAISDGILVVASVLAHGFYQWKSN
ncbi:hypothetical protein DPMN_181526 [Dreissena polymorpha]|uniref:Uncharacterized protein n=1 Tax=Dreissena polymorpha TaxID=45954 RepID=A0A9D4DD24_DREPO|nr:hypothetical protein DPMN_181526 [Dreissena polymorpha]